MNSTLISRCTAIVAVIFLAIFGPYALVEYNDVSDTLPYFMFGCVWVALMFLACVVAMWSFLDNTPVVTNTLVEEEYNGKNHGKKKRLARNRKRR
jgi:hypothetical protein